MMDALLGGLVVGMISNGLLLLGLSASAQLVWTALVLIGAVDEVDAPRTWHGLNQGSIGNSVRYWRRVPHRDT